jgi:hypothetical protein
MQFKSNLLYWASLPVLAGSLLLGGCASKGEPPTDKLALVETSVTHAKESEAYTYAPLEIKLAEEKLAQAKQKIAEKEYDQARVLLDQALVDARLAESKSQSEKTKRGAQEMKDSIETLRKETERK